MSVIPAPPAGRVWVWPALLAAGLAWADDVPLLADNIVPIEVRQFKAGQINTIFVEVTVCNAASSCRTVPNVVVDTGSAGLRLYRGALDGLELEAVSAADGRPLSNWTNFGTRSLWGTIHSAQVGIGRVTTTQPIPIELYDMPSAGDRLPKAYLRVDSRDWFGRTANGVLGISPWRHHAEGYYVDRHWGGSQSKPDWREVSVDTPRQLANPMAYFPEPYNNGSVIQMFDAEPAAAYPKLRGWLGLGVGLRTYGLFPGEARVIAQELDEQRRIPLLIGERRFDVLIDSGTNMLALDLDHLGHPGIFYRGGGDERYDAPTATPIELTALCGKHKVKLAQPVYVGPAQALFWGDLGYAVVPALTITSRPVQGQGTLGSPFFYGRTVATGLRGTVNPFCQPAPAAGLHGDVACDEALAPYSPSPNGYVAYTDDPRSGERAD